MTDQEAREPHDCESCAACVHNGQKCCGCYDGVCCQQTDQEARDDEPTIADCSMATAQALGLTPAERREGLDLIATAAARTCSPSTPLCLGALRGGTCSCDDPDDA